MYPTAQNDFVVTTIEHRDLARERQTALIAPQKVLAKFSMVRSAERPYMHPVGIDLVQSMPDQPVLAGPVDALHDHQNGVGPVSEQLSLTVRNAFPKRLHHAPECGIALIRPRDARGAVRQTECRIARYLELRKDGRDGFRRLVWWHCSSVHRE